LDQEFDAITSAFSAASGHRHNGTVGEGAPITVVGPTQNVTISTNSITPSVDNTVDLGSAALEFKNIWIDGVAQIDSLVADTADVNGGTVDATAIGATTPSTGAFTTLSSSGAATLASATVGGAAVTTASNVQTLTNKTINLSSNTLVTTNAQLGAATGQGGTGTGALVFAVGPTFSGAPAAPTAAVNTNTTQIATTAYVVAQIADDAPTKTGSGASGSWAINAATATTLETPRTINGTSFSGAANIVTSLWGTARNLTIGATAKAVDGSIAVAWSLAEIGAQAVNAVLTGLSSLAATPGILVQTAANTFAIRSLAVTANTGVGVTNGDGVAGNPTIAGVTQVQGTWDAGASTTEAVISPNKLSSTITTQKITTPASQVTTSGTNFDFTGIPSTAKRITVIGNGVSLTGTDSPMVRLGTGGGFVSAGYSSAVSTIAGVSTNTNAFTSGFGVGWNVAAEANTFTCVLTRVATSNAWTYSSSGLRSVAGANTIGAGSITLGAALTQVQLTRAGTDTFDAGVVSITWE